MKILSPERPFFGNNVMLLNQNENCIVYKMKNASGEGTMTVYPVFPGIDLIYNDFHMQNCFSEFQPKIEMIGIDHCYKGRIEWEFENDGSMYFQEGDLQISAKDHHALGFGFPLNHYHGITIAIYIEKAAKTLSSIFNIFPVDLRALRHKFCSYNKPFIMRTENSIQHIFSELYTVPDMIRLNYYKIKVMELLLYLSTVNVPQQSNNRAYFPKNQVDTIKTMMKYMTEHIDKHFTLEELSSRFRISQTAMKICFKGIYGTSIYAYMRIYRMQAAALMLRQTNDSVTAIASKVGYDNSSKFAAAFKEVIDLPPLKYRKNS